MNKKAVSPLVATVLLIAFAVSLGAVVMNWTSSGSGDGSSASTSKEAACEDVSVTILNKGSSKAICLDRDSKKIVIDLENGPTRIDGFRLSYLAKTSDFIDYNKAVEAGVLSHLELDYDPVLYGELRSVKIVPTIVAEDVIYCTSKDISFSVIEDC